MFLWLPFSKSSGRFGISTSFTTTAAPCTMLTLRITPVNEAWSGWRLYVTLSSLVSILERLSLSARLPAATSSMLWLVTHRASQIDANSKGQILSAEKAWPARPLSTVQSWDCSGRQRGVQFRAKYVIQSMQRSRREFLPFNFLETGTQIYFTELLTPYIWPWSNSGATNSTVLSLGFFSEPDMVR